MRKFLLVSIFLVLFSICLKAQSASEVLRRQDSLGLYSWKYGGFFDYSINSHSTPKFFGYKLDLSSDNGMGDFSGSGINAGIFIEYPLNESMNIMVRLGYHSLTGNFLTTENVLAGTDGAPIDSKLEFNFEANLAAFDIEPFYTYNFFNYGKLGINFLGGLSLNMLLTKTYTQHEKILTPGVTFTSNNSDTKYEVMNEPIPNSSSILYGATGGLSFDYALTPRYLASLEVLYNLGLAKVTTADDWSVSSFRIGIAGKYIGDRKCPPGMTRNAEGQCEELPCAPGQIRNEDGECVCRPGRFVDKNGNCVCPPCPERYLLANDDCECIPFLFVDVNAEPILTTGLPAEIDDIELREAESVTEQTILNYVFFDEKSASIPAKYVKLTNDEQVLNFREEKIGDANNILKTYYNVLNIFGYRLFENPLLNVTLFSYNMGGSEANMPDLPDRRIDSVISYLKNVWKIPDLQIKRQVYNIAPDIARSNDKLILDEYRRVEFKIDSTNNRIFKPIKIKNIVLRMNRPRIDFLFDIIPVTKLESWNLKVHQEKNLLFEQSGKVAADKDKGPEFIQWYAGARANQINPDIRSINYTLFAKDRNGDTASSSKSINITHIKYNPERKPEDIDSTFSIYYYLFDEKDVSKDVSDISKYLNEIEFDPFNSKVSITGYTDKLGDANANRLLSDARARDVGFYLKEKKDLNLSRTSATGRGYVELYDNNLPEGRFYNRLVVVEISTPLKEKEKVADLVEGCFVLVYSDEDEARAKAMLDYLTRRGAKDLYIEKKLMVSIDKNHYRVRTKPFENVNDAARAKGILGLYLKQQNLEKPPTIDCTKKEVK